MEIIKPNVVWARPLPNMRQSPRKLVQHHMANQTWRFMDVHQYHKFGKGWYGIGYHFWIAFDGDIYQGRPLGKMGAGVRHHNEYTIHIGYQGHLCVQYMTDAQVEAGANVNRMLMGKYSLGLADIVGHNYFAATACPGGNFRMADLKRIVGGDKIPIKEVDTVRLLQDGSRGNDVKQLQQALIDLGYNLSKYGADGIFGDETEAAVRAFQRDAGIGVDGIVGDETRGALDKALDDTAEKESAIVTLGGRRLKIELL